MATARPKSVTETREKSYTEQMLEFMPMWKLMGFEGLEGFADKFEPKLADREIAKQLALLDSCTKVRVIDDPEDSFKAIDSKQTHELSYTGLEIASLDRMTSKFGTVKAAALGEFGCPARAPPFLRLNRSVVLTGPWRIRQVAVALYLRVNLELCLVFLAAFVLSLPHVLDNYGRNLLRNQCREALFGNYSSVVGDPTDAANPAWYATCGYANLPIKFMGSGGPGVPPIAPVLPFSTSGLYSIIATVMNGPLLWTLGTCSEYSSYTNHTTPVPGLTTARVFVGVPTSAFCTGAGSTLAFWCDMLLDLMIICYLVYLRWRTRMAAMDEDRASLTTGDFAVELRGLAHGLDEGAPEAERMTAPKLRVAIIDDLAELGFPLDRVHQVELGRRCRRELKLMKKLELANITRHEVAARELKRKQRRAGATVAVSSTKDEAEDLEDLEDHAEDLAELAGKMGAYARELEQLYNEPDYATGHAFVVFKYDGLGQRAARRCTPTAAQLATCDCIPTGVPNCCRYEADKSKLLNLLGARTDRRHLVQRLMGAAAPPPKAPSTKMPRAAPAGGVEAKVSPEPSEVYWENLELTEEHERKWVRIGYAVTGGLILVGFVSIILVRWGKQKNAEGGGGSTAMKLAFTGGASLTTFLVDLVIKKCVIKLTSKEGQDSKTEHQASIFSKLWPAQVINSALVPLLVRVLMPSYT